MKLTRIVILFLLPIQFAFAAIFTIVPFPLPYPIEQNSGTPLQPGDLIYASYNSEGHPGIYCYENTFQFDPPVASMSWPFFGQRTFAPLSQTPIIFNNNFGGLPADSSGTIIIQNISSSTIFVSCKFTF